MSNQTTYQVKSPRSEVIQVYDKIVGNGTGAPSRPNDGTFSEFVTAVTRNSAGNWTLAFGKKYPQLLHPNPRVVGATAGLCARFSAIDVKAGTATLILEVAGTATDAATTDTVYIELVVRNSGRNS